MKILLFITALLLYVNSNAEQATDCKNPLIDSISVVRCISITDGDTWKFQLKNDIFSVRVLGIDCYETKNNDRLRKQASKNGISPDSALKLGLKAKHLIDSLFTGQEITIVRDGEQRNFDVYNRILRHCFLKGMINYAELIKTQGLTVNE